MQIWSSKFTTYLHLSQTLVNPFFRPVLKSVFDSPQISGSFNVQDGEIALFPEKK